MNTKYLILHTICFTITHWNVAEGGRKEETPIDGPGINDMNAGGTPRKSGRPPLPPKSNIPFPGYSIHSKNVQYDEGYDPSNSVNSSSISRSHRSGKSLGITDMTGSRTPRTPRGRDSYSNSRNVSGSGDYSYSRSRDVSGSGDYSYSRSRDVSGSGDYSHSRSRDVSGSGDYTYSRSRDVSQSRDRDYDYETRKPKSDHHARYSSDLTDGQPDGHPEEYSALTIQTQTYGDRIDMGVYSEGLNPVDQEDQVVRYDGIPISLKRTSRISWVGPTKSDCFNPTITEVMYHFWKTSKVHEIQRMLGIPSTLILEKQRSKYSLVELKRATLCQILLSRPYGRSNGLYSPDIKRNLSVRKKILSAYYKYAEKVTRYVQLGDVLEKVEYPEEVAVCVYTKKEWKNGPHYKKFYVSSGMVQFTYFMFMEHKEPTLKPFSKRSPEDYIQPVSFIVLNEKEIDALETFTTGIVKDPKKEEEGKKKKGFNLLLQK